MKDKRIKLLRDTPIKKSVVSLAIPAIISFMVMAIYNMVDTMYVSWIGFESTGAIQVVYPMMMLASSIGLSFGVGGGSYLSRLLGKRDMDTAAKVTSTAFFSAIAIGIIYFISTNVFLESTLHFFGADSSIMKLSKEYATYILIGALFVVPSMVLNNLLRAEGSSKLSMFAMVTGAVINIVLDPIFIFTFGLGISGAAIATMLSQIITFIMLLSHYLTGKSLINLQIKKFTPSKEIYGEIFKIGFPTFSRLILFSISLALLNQQCIKYGGPLLLAAMGISYKLILFPYYILLGIGQGLQPVVGYNFGAKNKERVMEATNFAIKIAIKIALFSGILLIIFAPQLFNVFKATPDVTVYGVKGLRYLSVGIIFMGLSNTVGIFYQALGKGKQAMFLSTSRQGVLFLPFIYILPIFMGVDGILIAQMVADILTAGIAYVMFLPYLNSDKLLVEFER